MKKTYWIASIVVVAAVGFWIYINQVGFKHGDEYYMDFAIQQAKHNTANPFGAVIVDNKTGEVLAEGFNRTGENPILHAEIVAINNCVKNHPHVDWKNTTLYTTAEPCPMCQSAAVWTGITRVVYGTSMEYLKMHGWQQIDINAAEINGKSPFYHGAITAGVLHDKTDALFNNSKLHPALQLA